MHGRREGDRITESCPWPSNEVLPGKTKVLSYPFSVGIGSLYLPQHLHTIPNSHPMFFWNSIFGSIVTGFTCPRGSKIRLNLLAVIRRVILGVRMLSGKANELLSIILGGFLVVFFVFLAQFI